MVPGREVARGAPSLLGRTRGFGFPNRPMQSLREFLVRVLERVRRQHGQR